MAEALRLKESAGQSLIESVKRYLRERELLLLLDNFEQIVDAAPLLADLLKACASATPTTSCDLQSELSQSYAASSRRPGWRGWRPTTITCAPRWSGPCSEARRLMFDESMAIFRKLGDRQGMGWALARLGLVHMFLGELPAARPLLEESLALCRAVGDRWGAASGSC